MTIDQSLRRDLLKSTGGPSHHSNDSGEGKPVTGVDLDQHLVSSSKQVLLKTIDFQPAERDVSFQLQNLRVKYVPLNPGKSSKAEEESAVKSSKEGSYVFFLEGWISLKAYFTPICGNQIKMCMCHCTVYS